MPFGWQAILRSICIPGAGVAARPSEYSVWASVSAGPITWRRISAAAT